MKDNEYQKSKIEKRRIGEKKREKMRIGWKKKEKSRIEILAFLY